MRLLCTVLITACIATNAYAAVAIFPAEPKPVEFACQEGCYLKSLNRVLPYNEPFYPEGECLQYTCQTNNETQLFTCGVIAAPPNCHVVKDSTQNYPDCCGKPVCDTTTDAEAQADEVTTNEACQPNHRQPARIHQ